MKLLIAIIKPYKLEDVRAALTDLGVGGMMVTEIKGFGAQSGHTEIYRGAEYAVHYLPKLKLEIALGDDLVDPAIDAIRRTAAIGKIGDGKVFVLDLDQAVRLRTDERGDAAL